MMDKLRLETLAVRVVEWHNRHPLARRIGVQHVQSIGYVALPFHAGDAGAPATAADSSAGASLRERAMARARQPAAVPPAAPAPVRPPEAAFDEAFLGPIRPAQVARWATQHAREITVEPADGPVRRVAAMGAGSIRTRYALTALVEIAGRRSRVLVGAGERPAVLGRRLWSLPRMVAVAGALAVAAGLAWIWQNVPPQGAAPAASPAASAASAAVAASAAPPTTSTRAEVALRAASAPPAAPAAAVTKPASAPIALAATPRPAAAPPLAASTPASSPPTAALPAPPLDVEPQLGRITLPPLNLPRADAARSAARAKQAASAASAGQPSAAAQGPEPGAAAVAAPAPGAPSFAVSTRILRTRAESEQVMVAMQALLATTGARGVRVEIVPAGADWRVVGWPFAKRDEAERARALLASRGMRVEVVDF